MSVRAAVVQMCCTEDVSANLEQMSSLVSAAADSGAELVVLPENFGFLGAETGRRAVAEDLDGGEGPMLRAVRRVARRHGLWLVAGGMPERSSDPERPYTTCVALAPDGALLARYRKIHLFDVDLGEQMNFRETEACLPGDELVVVELAGVPVGLSVCYDLRFPELYRQLVQAGAQLLVVPSAFTLMTGKDHWQVLLRARAIEDQAFVLAADQWGSHGERTSYGKSCVIDPWGEVVAQASEGIGVAMADLDLGYLEAVRRRLPSLQHRRLK